MIFLIKSIACVSTAQNQNFPLSRYTLTGSERNYQIRILSNQLNKLFFSSSTINKAATHSNMNPLFFTGFSDGEASFSINIYKSSSHIGGWVKKKK